MLARTHSDGLALFDERRASLAIELEDHVEKSRLPVGVTIVLGTTGIGLWQYTAFEKEREGLRSTRRQLERNLENAKTTAVRFDELRTEFERKEGVLAALRSILPETLDVASFFDDLAALGREHDVRVVQKDVTTHRDDFYEESIFTLELQGDDRAIAELEAIVTKRTRIVHGRYLDDESRASVALSVFAAPLPPDDRDRELCPAPDGGESVVWLRPFADELATERGRIDAICTELARLKPIADMIERYQRLLTELEDSPL